MNDIVLDEINPEDFKRWNNFETPTRKDLEVFINEKCIPLMKKA